MRRDGATKMSLQKVSERWLIAWDSKTRNAMKVAVKITSVINQYFVDNVSGACQEHRDQKVDAPDRIGHQMPGMICPVSA